MEWKKQAGFTLIELMLAMSISLIVLSAIYVTHNYQASSYTAQEHISDMQQNLRAAMFVMSRELRMAGYDPFSREDKLADGLDNDCDSFVDEEGEFVGILLANSDSIGFNMSLFDGVDNDLDGDVDEPEEAGILDPVNASPDDLDPCGDRERVSYSLYTSSWGPRCLGRDTGGGRQPVAENIEAVNFVYLDGSGNVLDDGGGAVTTNLDEIRSVQVTLVARSRKTDPKIVNTSVYRNMQGEVVFTAPGDHFRRLSQSIEVRCRNLGIAQSYAAMRNP